MLPKTLSVSTIDNKNWTPLKKLWLKLKIIRNQARNCKDPEIVSKLKEEEIEVSGKIVKLSKTVTDGNGKRITVPFFALLGKDQ